MSKVTLKKYLGTFTYSGDIRSYSCSFSRHAKAQTSSALVIWLNENVHF